MDTEARLIDLYNSLGEFKPTDDASWQIAQVYNVKGAIIDVAPQAAAR